MAGYADCLAGFIAALGVADPHLVGLSFGGALALAVAARHPGLARSLVVVSGYAGGGGSLPPEIAEQRLSQALALSALTSEEVVDALLPTMFATMPAAVDVDRFAASMRAAFDPAAGVPWPPRRRKFCADCWRASTSQHSGVRRSACSATVPVAEHLHTAIAGSELTVLPGLGHVCNLEGPDQFNTTLRAWLQRHH